MQQHQPDIVWKPRSSLIGVKPIEISVVGIFSGDGAEGTKNSDRDLEVRKTKRVQKKISG